MSIDQVATLARVTALALMAITSTAALAEPPAIENLESRYADIGDGVRLHHWVGGSGEPVVPLHGWPETGHAWREVVPSLLDAGYQVVVPDLRGLGDSSRPDDGYVTACAWPRTSTRSDGGFTLGGPQHFET